MKRITFSIVAALLLAATSHAQGGVEIKLKNNSAAEQATRAQLERLLGTHDLARWTFTKSVLVDEKAIPHSHPVLTLSARHVRDDELLLSTYVHEQIHWFLTQNFERTEAAKKELRGMFPKVPVAFPEGAKDEESTYLHLLVVYLEYRADRELLGELRARQVMEFWANDHYTWIYRTVLERAPDIGKVAFKHKLVPS